MTATIGEKMLTRQGHVTRPADTDERIAVATLSTGQDVRRRDFFTGEVFIERLTISTAAIRMGRLLNASVIDGHSISEGIGPVLGHVESATITGNALVGVLRITDDAAWAKVRALSVKQVSLGYAIHAVEITEATADSPQIRTATDWEPMETSLIVVAADSGALITETRSIPHGGNSPMTQTTQPTPAELTRRDGIQNAVLASRMPAHRADEMIADGVSLAVAQGRALDFTRERTGDDGARPNINGMEMVRDGADTARHGVEAALLHRMNPSRWKVEDNGAAREFLGMTLRELESGFKRRGGSGWMERGGSHTQSDFSSIVLDSMNKDLRARYSDAEPTFQAITSERTANDFKELNSIQAGDAPKLLETIEGAEITHGTLSDSREKYRVKRFSRIVNLSYELLINDDFEAFAQLPRMFASSARQTESDIVWEALTSNPAMHDSVKLFHADHLNTATSAAAISVASLGLMLAALRGQKSLDDQFIGLEPAFLIVAPKNETAARQHTKTVNADQASNVNPFDNLSVVVEPRLSADSLNRWYVAASSGQLATLEVARLVGQGAGGPEISSMEDFDTRAMKTRCELSVGSRALDWRPIQRNNGA